MKILALYALLPLLLLTTGRAATPENADFTRERDVVYGRKYGMALTMDVFEPAKNANGATVIWVVSGGWFSSHTAINPDSTIAPINGLIDRGYKVCAVVHGSNPLFTAEDAVSDLKRAIQFIRHRAIEEGQTTMPLGIIGASAGGHLSLMAGTTGGDGEKDSKDPVEHASSRIQAVACYFPPTDFLNYGDTHVNGRETTLGRLFTAPFQFRRYNADTKTLDRVTSPALLVEILADISPATHVSPDDAPTLIIHGDADVLVPYQQAELFVAKMKEAGAEIQLIRRPGAGHGWSTIAEDNETLFDWLDKHLLK